MNHGKKICEHLKVVRKQIADANDIPYEITECPHQGPCAGTCPKCESELRYIENQLSLRRAAGKAVSLVGLSLGISSVFAAQEVNNDSVAVKTDSISSESQGVEVTEGAIEANAMFGCLVESVPEFRGGKIAIHAFLFKNLDFTRTNSQGRKMFYRFSDFEEPFPNFQFLLSSEDEEKEETLPPLKEDDHKDRVRVSFIIEKDGSVSNVKILQSTDQELSDEVERVIKLMPKWKPGRVGKLVKVKCIWTLDFTTQILPTLKLPEQPTPNMKKRIKK